MEANVTLKKTDLNQYGEKYEVCIELENGFKFSVTMQEHEYNHINQRFNDKETSGQWNQNEVYS